MPLTVLAGGLIGPTRAHATIGVNDYPYANSTPDQPDPWGELTRECTSFVAWRLNHDEGVPFTLHYKGGTFGDAWTWAGQARSVGIPVDSNPTPGSVAVWPASLPGSNARGHVAFVLSSGAGSVTVEDYNWIRFAYDNHTLSASGVQFIHFNTISRRDVVAVKMQNTGSGRTEVHALSGSSNYQSFGLHTAIPLEPSNWYTYQFAMADYNGDGIPDLYIFKLHGTTSTEVHVLDGATNFQTFLLHASTPLGITDSSMFTFGVGDYNGDGHPDVYAIKMRATGSGRTEVHILDGATNYQTWLDHVAVPLGPTDDYNWAFGIADYNHDGRPDLYVFALRNTGSGRTEVHVLDGASNYQSFSLHSSTALEQTDGVNWAIGVSDYNGDGQPDIYALKLQGTHSTEVHVLDGNNLGRFLTHLATPLEKTNTIAFQFAVS